MKKVLLLLVPLLLAPLVQAEEETCLYYFYGQGCPHCARTDPFISELEEKYPEIEFYKYEIYYNRSNLLLLNDFFDRYGVKHEDRGIPAAFLANRYLIGARPILNNLETLIKEELACVAQPINATGQVGIASELEERLSLPSLSVILSAAAIDSINPCAIAVLLILLSALLIAGERKRALKAGTAFTLSIYIVYFLFGLGLFTAIQASGLSYYFYKAVGVLAIAIGLFNLKDYFRYGALGFRMEIPLSWRPKLRTLLKSVTSPLGAFAAGFLVCLFELPCTGGPYLYVLGLLAEKTTRVLAIPTLLLYNLVFVLPLIILTLALYFGLTSIERAESWKERNIKRLHLITGVIMVVLGLVVLLGLI